MTNLVTPTAVFVPYVWDGLDWKKRNDIPRFVEPDECIAYLASHPKLAKYKVEWREHSEKELIEEYVAGVGTNRFRRPQ